MKKKIFASAVLLVCFSLFCTAQKQTLKIASIAPNRSPWDIEQRKLAQEWARISNGDITLQFFDANALGGENGVIQKLRSARPNQKAPLDGAIFTNLGVYDLAPASKVLTLCTPFMFRNQAEVDYIFGLYEEEMKQAVRDKGYVLLGWFSVGWLRFATKEPANTPEKLKAARLALGGFGSPELTNAFKTAGFSVENISPEKITQSLKSPGGVQGVFSIPMYLYAMRYHESTRYIIDEPICPILTAFVISESAWNSIPESLRVKLLAEVRKCEELFITTQVENDEKYIQIMEKEGAVRISLTPQERLNWEKVLTRDISDLLGAGSSVIDKTFYDRIMKSLADYRQGKR